MSIVSLVVLVIFIGFTILTKVETTSENKPQSSPEVMSQTDEKASPSASLLNIPTTTPTPKSSTSNSQVNINLDTQAGTKQITIKLLYPGATKIDSQNGQEKYRTSSDGDTVYNWYKTELKNRSFNIRNNVRTKANDNFKAIVQALSNDAAIKVTIEQTSTMAETTITLE